MHEFLNYFLLPEGPQSKRALSLKDKTKLKEIHFLINL